MNLGVFLHTISLTPQQDDIYKTLDKCLHSYRQCNTLIPCYIAGKFAELKRLNGAKEPPLRTIHLQNPTIMPNINCNRKYIYRSRLRRF